MLIIALVLALIGLVALVFAVVTSNELVAWVCIAASVLGVVLLIIDAVQERRRRDAGDKDEGDGEDADSGDDEAGYVDYPEEVPDEGGEDADTGVDESAQEAGTDVSEESAVSAEGRGDDRAK
jgi:hypothetical protein